VPSDLYQYLNLSGPAEKAAPGQKNLNQIALRLNGQEIDLSELTMERGYVLLRRQWKKGDTLELALPLEAKRVVAHEKVKEDAGKVAIERGPLVYCFEAVDNQGKVLGRQIPDDMVFEAVFMPKLLGGVIILQGQNKRGEKLVAVPYYAWNHRRAGEMAVWLLRAPEKGTQ